MQMAVTLQNHSEIFKFPVFSLCFSKIFKFPVFSLSGITFHNFPCFPCAVGTLTNEICQVIYSLLNGQFIFLLFIYLPIYLFTYLFGVLRHF